MWQILALAFALLALAPFAADLATAWWSRAQPWVAKAFLFVAGAANRSSATIGNKFTWLAIGLALGMFAHLGIARLPAIQWPEWVTPIVAPVVPPAPAKPTKVTYVYEKDQGGIPSGVLVALDKLNRQGIVATDFEDDITNGSQQVPAQYRIAKAEAEKAGLPALVVQAGDSVLRVVKAPTTETQVTEAAK